jgi:hypothetical protein
MSVKPILTLILSYLLLVRVKELSTPPQCLQTAFHLELEKFLPPGEGHPHLLEVAGLLLQAGLPLPFLYRKLA